MRLHTVWCDVRQVFETTVGRASPRGSERAPTQLHHDSALRFVFDGEQGLFSSRCHRLKLIFRQRRTQDDVAVDSQCFAELISNRRTGKRQVIRAGGFAPLQTQVVERREQLAAAEITGSTSDPVSQHPGGAIAIVGIVDAPGGDHECERGRLHVLHLFDNQRQAVVKGVRVDVLLLHEGHPAGGGRRRASYPLREFILSRRPVQDGARSIAEAGKVLNLRLSQRAGCRRTMVANTLAHKKSPAGRARPYGAGIDSPKRAETFPCLLKLQFVFLTSIVRPSSNPMLTSSVPIFGNTN